MIYLDNASTTIIEKEVLDSYQALLSAYYANPSGIAESSPKSSVFSASIFKKRR